MPSVVLKTFLTPGRSPYLRHLNDRSGVRHQRRELLAHHSGYREQGPDGTFMARLPATPLAVGTITLAVRLLIRGAPLATSEVFSRTAASASSMRYARSVHNINWESLF